VVKAVHVGFIQGNHASALGKAILAHLPQEQFEQYFADRPLPNYTTKTITDIDSLKKYLTQVREEGYALDREEFMEDVHCISAPIFDAQGAAIAAIAISLPAVRSEQNLTNLIAKVKQAANSASRTLILLGYVLPQELIEEAA